MEKKIFLKIFPKNFWKKIWEKISRKIFLNFFFRIFWIYISWSEKICKNKITFHPPLSETTVHCPLVSFMAASAAVFSTVTDEILKFSNFQKLLLSWYLSSSDCESAEQQSENLSIWGFCQSLVLTEKRSKLASPRRGSIHSTSKRCMSFYPICTARHENNTNRTTALRHQNISVTRQFQLCNNRPAAE